ncbi:MAG TPA: ATP-binding protein [Gaiellaceae bacterium]|nr:ATP-binding protein [Gaiellaceae bacterium]
MTRRSLRTAIILSSALFLGAWLATPLPHQIRIGAIDLLWFLTALLAGIACIAAYRRPENAHLRRSFALFAAGSLVWAAGQAVWTYQELVQELDSPVFGLADAGFVLAVPLLGVAVAHWPREAVPWSLGRALDFAIVAGFAGFFGIELVLAPMLDLEGGGIETFYAVVYPPAEIFLFGVLLAALTLAGWRDRARLELISFALLAMCIGDAGYAYLGDDYATGGLLDPLWIVGFAGLGWAALTPAGWRERRGWIGERARALAPSAALILLALVGVGIGVAGREPLDTPDRVALLLLVLLLAARQAHTQLTLLEQMKEQRRLQDRLQQSQKLEAVGRLAGGVAHDFNNLLTAIDGYSSLALNQLAADHPVRTDIDEVRRAAQRAAELTRQLLAFSRRQVLAPRVVDLNAVVTDARRMLATLAGEHIELRLALDPRPALVRADPAQLEQVVTNLVVNARDAMPSGGTISIATASGSERVLLTVSDTGAGMTEETRSHAFEPFFTTKELGKGTGLGLAVVHGIVAQSGGEISVSSRPGLGSSFELCFPPAPENAAEPVVSESARPEGGSETVLLVEDESAVRDLARRMLELAGYTVLSAASGEEAEQIFGTAGTVDVLVTDLVMPGMSGRELANRLRRGRPELSVVLMSGYSQDAAALDRLLGEGAAFVEKPFSSSELVSEVRGVLDAA